MIIQHLTSSSSAKYSYGRRLLSEQDQADVDNFMREMQRRVDRHEAEANPFSLAAMLDLAEDLPQPKPEGAEAKWQRRQTGHARRMAQRHMLDRYTTAIIDKNSIIHIKNRVYS